MVAGTKADKGGLRLQDGEAGTCSGNACVASNLQSRYLHDQPDCWHEGGHGGPPVRESSCLPFLCAGELVSEGTLHGSSSGWVASRGAGMGAAALRRARSVESATSAVSWPA